MKTTDKATTIGVLDKAKAKACKMYARDLPNDAPVGIVDGGADFTVLYRGFKITSLYDGHGATTALNSLFSSIGRLLLRGTGLTTYLNHEGKAMALLQIYQGCVGDQAENETLVASDQLEWHGVKVMDRPIIFGGQQCLTNRTWTINLL